ncbi:MAG: DUF2306 domain-containing protein [Bacteroidota bacterium]
MMKISLRPFTAVSSFVFISIVMGSTFLMARIIVPYLSWRWDVDFLITKQMIIHLDHYRFSFYAHIFSSGFVLFFGAFLFSPYVLRKCARLHRTLGKLYVGFILLLSAPSGLVMAFYANGGFWVQLSFIILAPLWWSSTYLGLSAIRRGDIRKHKKWMIRSYALTLSAISLRAYQTVLGQVEIIEPEYQYLFISWASWIGNLLIVEFFFLVSKIGVLLNKLRLERIIMKPN